MVHVRLHFFLTLLMGAMSVQIVRAQPGDPKFGSPADERKGVSALFSRTQKVKWSPTVAGATVTLEVSLNGGRDWAAIPGAGGIADSGEFVWDSTSAGGNSTECVLRITRNDGAKANSDTFVLENGEQLETHVGKGETDPAAAGSPYRSVDEIRDALDALKAANPDILTLKTVPGTETLPTPLRVAIISEPGDNKKDSQELKTAVFVNAGLHAREWISPESALKLVEELVDPSSLSEELRNAIQRLRETTKIYVLVLSNPEGTRFSHKFWNKSVFYPRYAELPGLGRAYSDPVMLRLASIRDGRYRRRDRRDKLDELLFNGGENGSNPPTNTADALSGVDLNRNFTTGFAGVACETHETYTGPGAKSEPETAAIEDFLTSEFGGALKLLGSLDIHNNLQAVLVSIPEGTPANYSDIVRQVHADLVTEANKSGFTFAATENPPPAGSYRAHAAVGTPFKIPSYGLELPHNDAKAKEAATTSLFVPDAEIGAIYSAARGVALTLVDWSTKPAYVKAVEIQSSGGYNGSWVDSSPTLRTLTVTEFSPLSPGDHTVIIRFSRPMQILNRQEKPPDPVVTWGSTPPYRRHSVRKGLGWTKTTWENDTWVGIITIPDDPRVCSGGLVVGSVHRLSISMRDPFKNLLDGDPSTIVDWESQWTKYENSLGEETFLGGKDWNHVFSCGAGP